jgi:hypothetical protein
MSVRFIRNGPKSEAIWFFTFVALLIFPLFSLDFFVTHDGPAHVYNAHLIRNFLTGTAGGAADFFELKIFPEPNWTGHALLAVLNLLLPGRIAEKILVGCIIFFFAYFFRRLIRNINA